MPKRSVANLRRFSPWLAFGLSFIILACTISLTLLWPSGNSALVEGSIIGGIATVLGDYQGPQQCAECHAAEFHAWSGTTHAQASFDPVFQVYLQQAEQPGECFACHTTGYNAATGQFVMAGVTCEACHGPYRTEHPGESMRMATAVDLCGACHRSTLAEWQSSRHGQAGITCVACHEVHTQKTRAAVATDALCAGCHQDRTQDAIHKDHKAANVRCVACHVARPVDSQESAVSGHAITGHSFTVAAGTCNGCHNQ
jgi:predicted CXXCH cytochrome family protein